MNNVFNSFEEYLRSNSKINVHDFVSKQKKIVYVSLTRPLVSYIRKYWNRKKSFHRRYFLIQPELNQNIKFRFDYILIRKENVHQHQHEH